MPIVMLKGTEEIGFPTPMNRRRSFEDYADDYPYLPSLLLGKARRQDEVVFADIGCGEGVVATDFRDYLVRILEKKGSDPSMVDKIRYVGIDLIAGDNWGQDERTAFYQGDVKEILDNGNLPSFDVAMAHTSIPYMENKLGVLLAIANQLSPNGGVFHAESFYRHQLRKVDARPLDVRKLSKGDLAVKLDETSLTYQRKGSNVPERLPWEFSHSSPETTQVRKGMISQFFGQQICYYRAYTN